MSTSNTNNFLTPAGSVFLHGIGGSGMRALAWILQQRGKKIFGTDSAGKIDLPFVYQFVEEDQAADTLKLADEYIYSDAVPADHPLRVLAGSSGVRSLGYQTAVGLLSRDYVTIAVTGTHGKSSTTAFLAHVLSEAGLDPTALIGASVQGWRGNNARVGQGKFFVVEADEYRQHFLELQPTHAIITNIDWDHPDFFPSMADVERSYGLFLKQLPPNGSVVTTETTKKRFPSLPWPHNTVVPEAGLAQSCPEPIPGDHMKSNAALAVTMAQQLGISREQAVKNLASFPGLGRRMEKVGTINKMVVISDYAHHPAEISATLTAVRKKYAGQKIAAVFEVHMQERLEAFFDDFASALETADMVVIYPPFSPPGRERTGIDSRINDFHQLLVTRKPDSIYLRNGNDLGDCLKDLSENYDVAIALSAGNLDAAIRKAIA